MSGATTALNCVTIYLAHMYSPPSTGPGTPLSPPSISPVFDALWTADTVLSVIAIAASIVGMVRQESSFFTRTSLALAILVGVIGSVRLIG